MITYRARIGYQALDGEVINNYVRLTGDGIHKEEGISRYRYLSAGGKAQGYVYQIKILKSDKNDPNKGLAGAKFELIRNRTGAVIGEYESNQAGEIVIKNLLRDAYTLKETQAPAGYQLDPSPVAIEPEDFDSQRKLAIKSIPNKKLEEKFAIPVMKLWKGKALKEVSVFLKADGKKIREVKLSQANDWKYTFDNLAKFKSDGSRIDYTVEEAAFAGYRTEIKQNAADDPSQGFQIINTETPSWTPMIPPTREVKVTKLWLNAQAAPLSAPVNKIEVALYRDGELTAKRVTLSAENQWRGSFKELPVYASIEQPKAYEYSIKEVGENKDAIQVAGRWFKVTYQGTVKDGFTILNQEIPSWTPMSPPTRELKVTKTWLDAQSEILSAPVDKIAVELYRDGQASGKTLVLSRDNQWTGSFKDLPVYESLEKPQAYAYSVKEVGEDKGAIQVAGQEFKVTYQGTMKDGLTVVNQAYPPEKPEEPESPPVTPPETPEEPENPPVTPPDTPKEPESPPVTPPNTPEEPETPPVTPPDTPKEPESPPVTPPNTPEEPETPPVTPPDTPEEPETPPVTPPDTPEEPETPPVTPLDIPQEPESPPMTTEKVDQVAARTSRPAECSQPSQKQVSKQADLPRMGLDRGTRDWIALGFGAVFVGCLFAWLGKNKKSKRWDLSVE